MQLGTWENDMKKRRLHILCGFAAVLAVAMLPMGERAPLPASADVTFHADEPSQCAVHVGTDKLAYYDRSSARWQSFPIELSRPLSPLRPIVYGDDRLYCWDTDRNEVECFHLRGRTWTRIAGPPIGARKHYAVAYGSRRLAVWGGWAIDTGRHLADGAILDTRTLKWQIIPEARCPGGPDSRAVWAADRLLTLTASPRGPHGRRACQIFDPAQGLWFKTEPGEFLAEGLAASGHHVLVWGRPRKGEACESRVYDGRKNSWREGSKLVISFWGQAEGVAAGNKIYVFFGDEGTIKCPWACFDLDRGDWTGKGVAPISTGLFPRVANHRQSLYLWSGAPTEMAQSQSAAVFDLRAGSWRRIDDVPFLSEFTVIY
jgi:hypothetical protein